MFSNLITDLVTKFFLTTDLGTEFYFILATEFYFILAA